ncbi:MAG TPA: hypothetical protein DCO79_17140 [Spirochaeta sp.]|nr:hypothetical protein [Spirochaeta sp.]
MNPEIPSSELSAVVLAAGYSNRMSAIKAMYPVNDELIIERVIRILIEGGVERIYVVTGFKSVLLSNVLRDLKTNFPNLRIINNPDYDDGMYSSVCSAVKALPDDCEGFMLLPVDYPFIKPETIQNLLTSFAGSDVDVISPQCRGTSGHPPVISKAVFDSIMGGSGEGGLRAVLSKPEFTTGSIETGDEGILDDVDTDEAFLKLMRKYFDAGPDYPVTAEIKKLRRESGVPPGVIAHMEKVCETAVNFCEQLNASGARLHPGLLSAACRLHDICRTEPHHAAAAARLLTELGYPAVASIVSQHMEIDFAAGSHVDEAALLYLADKMVAGSSLVDLEERMNARLEQFGDNPEASENIRIRFEKAFLIQSRIDELTKN